MQRVLSGPRQSQSGMGLGKGAWRLALGAWHSQNFLRDMGLGAQDAEDL